jgi:anti-anti-sigma regulatory factor
MSGRRWLDLWEETMAAAFAVTRHDVNGVATLTVVGELDDASGDILTMMTLDAVTSDITGLIVDLSRVTWLDAAGVHALLLGHEAAGRANCTYQLATPAVWSSTSWRPKTGRAGCWSTHTSNRELAEPP